MRWHAGSLILITLVPTMAQANTCPDPSSPSSLFWSAAPFLLLAIYGAIWFWFWWNRPPAGVAFDRDDPEKIAATEEARRTLPQFWKAFENPAPDECDFALKFNLTPEKDAEFIWAYDLKLEDGRIYGKLGNEPVDPGYSPDQFYEINPADIVDWTYYKAGVAQGHFITRVMFKHMPKRFVTKTERALGWA